MPEPLGGFSAIAVLLIAAFSIDRLVSAVIFLLAFIDPWDAYFNPIRQSGELERDQAQRRQKLVYFVFAGICAGIVIKALDGYGILHHIGFQNYPLDIFLTVIILMGGAERLAELLKTPGAPGSASAAAEPPIRITGIVDLKPEHEPASMRKGA
jgi:hypothetical protein